MKIIFNSKSSNENVLLLLCTTPKTPLLIFCCIKRSKKLQNRKIQKSLSGFSFVNVFSHVFIFCLLISKCFHILWGIKVSIGIWWYAEFKAINLSINQNPRIKNKKSQTDGSQGWQLNQFWILDYPINQIYSVLESFTPVSVQHLLYNDQHEQSLNDKH